MPPSPLSIEKAVERSESVVLAKYLDCESLDSISYYSSPKTRFLKLKVLKGEKVPRHFFILYDFHTMQNHHKPPDWKFDQSMLPARDSEWILFLASKQFLHPEVFDTYRGSFGRLESSKMNLEIVKEEITKQRKIRREIIK